MVLKYNIDFELVTAMYLIIMYIFLRLKYSDQSEVNHEFRKLTLCILAADMLDVITAITISYGQMISPWLNMVLNMAYFGACAMMGYQCIFYIATYIYTKEERRRRLVTPKIIHSLYLALLVVNLFTGWIFRFNGQGEYLHGPIYFLVYAMPFAYELYTIAFLISKHKVFKKMQKLAIIAFVVLGTTGPVIQLLFCGDTLLSVFTMAVALLVMMFTLETPDYQKLMQTMEELERTKEEAQEANRIKTSFLEGMSHEVRTPINAILGYNDMIMQESQESNTVEYAVQVQASGRALLSQVNDVLDFAVIDGGKLKTEKNTYAVLSLLQDVVLYARYYVGRKDLKLHVSVEETLPEQLSGDSARLMQIINNLISNAVKYTEKGFVELSVEWQPEEENNGILKVQVRDSGTGMAQEDIEELTQSFSRGKNWKNSSVKGMGLGLSIVTGLVKLMDGKLEIESTVGSGSVFRIFIRQQIVNPSPIGRQDWNGDKVILHPSEMNRSLTAPNARILAVDDNEMNLDLVKGLLKSTKLHIDTAGNGEEALKLLEKKQYHLIFMDHMMPVMDGIETLKAIRKRGLCPHTPVIALTANAVAGAREKYLEAGFQAYLSKPIIRRQLEEMVWKYLPKELIQENGVAESDMVVPVEEQKQGLLDRLFFLDTTTGMTYCAGSEEFYQEMLTSYLNSNRYQEILGCYDRADWENYRIHVHALKSTSLTIGAGELSERAKQLEQATKEDNISYIQMNHKEVMQQYKELLEQLKKALENNSEEKTETVKLESGKAHILVVDDDAMNRKIAEKMLKSNYQVDSVESGKAALEFLEKEQPDLILLDIHMPDMDGFEVMECIMAQEKLRNIPVIFLTADNERDMEVKGFQKGALDFITKPFIADIMIQRVNRILELDRLQKYLQQEVDRQTQNAEERRRKVERMSLQMVQTLASTIDAKDKYTNGHSVRVAEYSRRIAVKLGKSEKEQEDIYYMGLLHDIGKIGIPDEIINKTSRLTDEEYAIIKKHPIIGADILKNISEMPGIETGARWHHERYDGRGYPDGLKEEEIPEMARIIGVADAYDAMASKRSYRDVLPQEVIKEEIRKGKGTQFAPDAADAMLELMEEDVEYLMRDDRMEVTKLEVKK